MSALLSPSSEIGDEKAMNPITSVIIVADKNKCPRGFFPITKTHDDQTDADLWKESSFSFFSRPVRYLAISRETPSNAVGVQVVTDLCVVKDTDPIPMGFIAIDYTADSKEKSLRKKYLCVRTMARDAVVDAVGEIVVLNRHKKPPRNFSSAGSSGLYPSVGENRHSAPVLAGGGSQKDVTSGVNALTIKLASARFGVDDVPFKLNPIIESSISRNKKTANLAANSCAAVLIAPSGSAVFLLAIPDNGSEQLDGSLGKTSVLDRACDSYDTYFMSVTMSALPALKVCDKARLESAFSYQFNLERATLSNP
ncbi:Multivesicular body subunit 12B [Toxocara canis]|uniref:Multivesicular body subunit 12B n=1 Tax=Toxocara canis TaxID=6265 RepID=A0A0B2VV92_TOXCA|nr:Multivesicular body subunit 12B [Toxocara canis]